MCSSLDFAPTELAGFDSITFYKDFAPTGLSGWPDAETEMNPVNPANQNGALLMRPSTSIAFVSACKARLILAEDGQHELALVRCFVDVFDLDADRI